MKKISLIVILAFLVLPACNSKAQDKALDIQQVKSPGNIEAWLIEDHALPIIAMKFAFRGAGAVLDPAGKQGLSLMASNTLDEGAGEYDSQAFQKALTDHSITLRFSSGRDDFTGTLQTLTRHKDLAFKLAGLALTAPRFDAEPVARMKNANISRIRSSLSDPEWIAARIMNDAAYDGHPYALNSGGTLTTLNAITPDDLRVFAAERLTRDRLLVSVVGDITADELKTVLDNIFGKLPAKGKIEPPKQVRIQNGGQTVFYSMDIPQTIIMMMQDGLARQDPDYHAAQVMNFILGSSGFGSRLTEEIREKRGLVYGVYTGLDALKYAPSLSLSTSTKNESAGEVLSLIKTEWNRIRDEAVSDKELEDAKSYLIGSVPLGLTSTGQIAGLMLGLQLDGLPPDYLDRREKAIGAMTKDGVQGIARRLLTPDNIATVLVGKPESITPTKTVMELPNVE